MALVSAAARLLRATVGPSLRARASAILLPVYDPYRRASYAQEGEDLIIDGLLKGKAIGSYVDVGAHDPIAISNTYRFYRRGWSGLNIDAAPGSMRRFGVLRRRDINLEAAVAEREETMTFNVFNLPGLNTFDPGLARQQDGKTSSAGDVIRIVQRVPIRTRRLGGLLDEHWPSGRPIDFLSIDVEGLGLSVLRSNDWDRYRPGIIVIEVHQARLDQLESIDEVAFLKPLGYRPVAKSATSLFFCAEPR
jgi:FkbM family methyltransferase